jgi:hypothetical protein
LYFTAILTVQVIKEEEYEVLYATKETASGWARIKASNGKSVNGAERSRPSSVSREAAQVS